MTAETNDPWRSKKTHAWLLLCIALSLQLAHAAFLLLSRHSVVVSNVFQLILPVMAALVCLHLRPAAAESIGRRCWTAVGWAFLIWSTAQLLYLYIEYFPHHLHWAFRPDDVLWTLFGLPLLLAIATTKQETDRVAWLDRAQVLLFFAVLYLLVFLPGTRLSLAKNYLIQNVALVLCCILRLPTCTLKQERRFFLRLSCFLIAYSVSESVAELFYARGWQMGSLVDLGWTLPISLFIVLSLWDALQQDRQEGSAMRLFQTVGSYQGLSVAALTFLSMGAAALLVTRHPWLGGVSVVSAFALFAWRTNARERLWHDAHGRLETAVLQDALTGLGNRIQLRNRLREQLDGPNCSRTVLLFADLDRFKQINDSLGHALGDRLLIEVAGRLVANSSAGSVVCRLGGDEFVVLTTAEDTEEAKAAGEALQQALHRPMQLGPHEVRCSASIGVVLASAEEKADDLLRTADHAMYRAKQLGRNRVQIFDAALRSQMNSRWHMEAELRAMVASNSIQVAFQPIYSVQQGSICGFEALARWSHPTLGEVPPSAFIPLAEESGLISTLGLQILEKASRQLAAWNQRWSTEFSLSVNVSPRQFTDIRLVPSLLEILERTGLRPELLRLEITESALLVDQQIVRHTLEQARAHGILISLDDFGTGYSSLSFLLSLPVDEVKVDRSFVSNMHQDPDREELVRTVIHLGHSLGKRVVAEGVETEQDLLDLAEMGCECMQGYLISRPLSADAMEAGLPSFTARAVPSQVVRTDGLAGSRNPRKRRASGSARQLQQA